MPAPPHSHPKSWAPTSCCSGPGGPLSPVGRVGRAAGRGIGCGAGNWHCAGRGQGGRRSQGHRNLYTPLQCPAPGRDESTAHPPGDTAPPNGTPCPPGTGLDGETADLDGVEETGEGEVWGTCRQVPGRSLPGRSKAEDALPAPGCRLAPGSATSATEHGATPHLG